jgi:hypothetical protein
VLVVEVLIRLAQMQRVPKVAMVAQVNLGLLPALSLQEEAVVLTEVQQPLRSKVPEV